MKKIFYLSILATFSTAHASLLHKDVNIEDSIKEARNYPAVCRILTQSSRGQGTATGTLCETKDGRKFILTSAHTISNKDEKSLDINVKVEFSDGTITPMLKSAIHDAYFSDFASNRADMGVLIPNGIPSTITPMQIGDEKDFNEKDFVTSIGFGRRGTFDDTGRGFYLSDPDNAYLKDALAVHLNVKIDEAPSYLNQNDPRDPVLERVKSLSKLPLEGALSAGGSGGPVIQNNRVFATNTSAAKDLIELYLPTNNPQRPNPAVYQVLQNSGREKLAENLRWMDSILPQFLKLPFRKSVKYFFAIPDFTINISQVMTFINESKRKWIENTVDQLLFSNGAASDTAESANH